jgi:hypothetical protein
MKTIAHKKKAWQQATEDRTEEKVEPTSVLDKINAYSSLSAST